MNKEIENFVAKKEKLDISKSNQDNFEKNKVG
jgi:hypothetical protein